MLVRLKIISILLFSSFTALCADILPLNDVTFIGSLWAASGTNGTTNISTASIWAYLTLDETNGVRFDISGSQHNFEEDGGMIEGVVSPAVINNGCCKAAYDFFSLLSTNNFTGSLLTVTMWVYLTNASPAANVIEIGDESDWPDATNQFRLTVLSGVMTAYDRSQMSEFVGFPQTNMWQFIAITLTSTNITFFTNGEYASRSNITHYPFDAKVGVWRNGANYHDWDEMSFWQRVLTTNEIQWLYNVGLGRRPIF